ncbi:MAG: hypothetical protein ACRDG7_15150, partial [Candidatus Limnocylindria bacterium]
MTTLASRAAALIGSPCGADARTPWRTIPVNTRVGALVALLIAAAITVVATAGVAAMTIIDTT